MGAFCIAARKGPKYEKWLMCIDFTCRVGASYTHLPPVVDEIGIVAVVDLFKRHAKRLRVDVAGDQAQRVDPRLLRYPAGCNRGPRHR